MVRMERLTQSAGSEFLHAPRGPSWSHQAVEARVSSSEASILPALVGQAVERFMKSVRQGRHATLQRPVSSSTGHKLNQVMPLKTL